jgi:hypothetical protein
MRAPVAAILPLYFAALAVAGCGDKPRRSAAANPACGIAAVAAPLKLLEEFGVPRQTLAEPPSRLPERLPVRFVAGPVLTGVVGRTHDSVVVVGVEGNVPSNFQPSFGVLVVDKSGTARGVVVYETRSVEGAPVIGSVTVGNRTIPLLGIELDMHKLDTPGCPFFPDSAAVR